MRRCPDSIWENTFSLKPTSFLFLTTQASSCYGTATAPIRENGFGLIDFFDRLVQTRRRQTLRHVPFLTTQAPSCYGAATAPIRENGFGLIDFFDGLFQTRRRQA